MQLPDSAVLLTFVVRSVAYELWVKGFHIAERAVVDGDANDAHVISVLHESEWDITVR
jgi:hypothetical protein